ncbi:hypothetical protein CLV30_109196 [Haloactinopolyspora alba]|uniref:Phage-related protein n=1 Tax=Haloactinopolyspora alba TaxID=648780 RepID=A0A2P8E088_9ACTN|nr:hypothetical protein [Haloactinopolyspora alba]PSL02888.1 hypothetical protein CLV30_109196 [Haloactinopolyspora alba]
MARQANQVTLTFAGDSDKLERSFENVGASAKTMSDDVGSASREMGDSTSSSFDRVGEAADNVDTKAMGFRDTLTGVTDTGKGLSQVMKGDLSGGLLTLGMGVGDLASGMYNFLIPSLKTVATRAAGTAKTMVVSSGRQVAAWAVLGAKSLVHAAKVAAAWLIAMGPIALVIAAVVGLVALIIKNWDKVWAVTKRIFGAVWNWLKGLWDKVVGFIGTAVGWIKDIFLRFSPLGIIIRNWGGITGWIKDMWNGVISFLSGLPGKISNAVSGMWDGITDAFKGAINTIIDGWNGFSLSIPSVDGDWNGPLPGGGFTIGGWSLDTPNIPRLHSGGIVPGSPGQEALAILQAGEKVTPANQVRERDRDLPDEFSVVGTIDLGEGITKVVEMKLRRHDKAVKNKTLAGTGVA